MAHVQTAVNISKTPGVTAITQPADSWKVGLCNVCHSGCCSACYACFCMPCAVASARSSMDGSDWCFNCCCMTAGIGLGPIVLRNIVREGYNIDGSCLTDILTGMFCAPCVVCQGQSETRVRGKANMQWGTNRNPTTQPWKSSLCGSCCDNMCMCLLATFFPGMVYAMARSKFDGSNCLFNCFCINACLAKSIVADGYNLESGWYENCCQVFLCYPCSACQMYSEVKARGPMNKVYVTLPPQAVPAMAR